MCLTVFLSIVIGTYLTLISLAMLTHQARYKKTMSEFYANTALVTYSGAINIILGLLLVVAHNIWDTEWPVLITIIGWITLLQGIYRVFQPMHFAKKMKEFQATKGYDLMIWVWLLAGIYLIWMGMSNN